MNKRNNFGVLSASYDTARRGYPQEVYSYLKSFIAGTSRTTLDIGCGTGLSTRELKENGFSVTGVDKDKSMIEVAQKHNSDITYIVAPAEALPFESESFNIVTAFTSFHWFTHEKAVNEIKRVLKPGGIFFAALKDNRYDEKSSAQQTEYKAILKKYVGDKYNSAKNYKPEAILTKCGFNKIEQEEFPVDEYYTVDDALTLVQSLSYWNLVPEESKPVMLKELRELYQKYVVDGHVIRYRQIETIIGFKQ